MGAELARANDVQKNTGKTVSIAAKNRQKTLRNPAFVHLLFTTADAKIPLSVVQVKLEPQYVVFCCGCMAPSSATR
jgi:hypothetical protein